MNKIFHKVRSKFQYRDGMSLGNSHWQLVPEVNSLVAESFVSYSMLIHFWSKNAFVSENDC